MAPRARRPGELEIKFEQHRRELTAYCYRMLASPFEAEDAVQETFIRAWKASTGSRAARRSRSWLYRIATNVCLDMLGGRERRARPMDLGPSREPIASNLNTLPEVTWIEPVPGRARGATTATPPSVAVARETIRLAFVAALQHLPPRQRAVLILCEVLRWQASEVAELLETSVAVGQQRAPAGAGDARGDATCQPADAGDRPWTRSSASCWGATSRRSSVRHGRADVAHPRGRDAVDAPVRPLASRARRHLHAGGSGRASAAAARGCIPTVAANGSPAFGQYKPSETGEGYDPWALQVLEIEDGRIVELTFFLDTETLFPLFGLPPRIDCLAAHSARTSSRPMKRDEVEELAATRSAAAPGSRSGGRRAAAARARRP